MMNVSLKVVGGELESKEVALTLPATVGRGRDVAVSLPHPLVSRRHCELLEHDGAILVRDLDSLNGTFVGSERVEEAVLNPGDLLTVGTVTFRAVYEPHLDPELETMIAPATTQVSTVSPPSTAAPVDAISDPSLAMTEDAGAAINDAAFNGVNPVAQDHPGMRGTQGIRIDDTPVQGGPHSRPSKSVADNPVPTTES